MTVDEHMHAAATVLADTVTPAQLAHAAAQTQLLFALAKQLAGGDGLQRAGRTAHDEFPTA